MEAEGINISDVIGSADVRYYLDADQTTMISGSLAVGENEFGTNTWVYGVGLQKLWVAMTTEMDKNFVQDLLN